MLRALTAPQDEPPVLTVQVSRIVALPAAVDRGARGEEIERVSHDAYQKAQ